jgi:phage-related minor tail protein
MAALTTAEILRQSRDLGLEYILVGSAAASAEATRLDSEVKAALEKSAQLQEQWRAAVARAEELNAAAVQAHENLKVWREVFQRLEDYLAQRDILISN